MPRRLPHSAWIVPGVGLFFALLFATQNYIRGVVLDQSDTIASIAIQSVPRWLLYAAFAPLVGALTRRAPLARGRLRAHLPIHVLAATVFAATHCVVIGEVYRLFHIYPPSDSIGVAVGRLMMVFFGVIIVGVPLSIPIIDVAQDIERVSPVLMVVFLLLVFAVLNVAIFMFTRTRFTRERIIRH